VVTVGHPFFLGKVTGRFYDEELPLILRELEKWVSMLFFIIFQNLKVF
jgi:hypothetical protein